MTKPASAIEPSAAALRARRDPASPAERGRAVALQGHKTHPATAEPVTAEPVTAEPVTAELAELPVQELHHRIRNNLQLVLSLLNLQLQSIDSPEARAALEESAHRVRVLSKAQDLFYHDSGNARVDLGERLHKFVALNLFPEQLGQEAQLTLQVRSLGAPVLISVEQALPCCLAVAELLTALRRYSEHSTAHPTVEVTVESTSSGFAITMRGAAVEAFRRRATQELLELRLAQGFAAQADATVEFPAGELPAGESATAGAAAILIRSTNTIF